MVLAAWVKKRQLKQGKEIGRAQGRAEVRRQFNAKLRALAKEYGIPENELPFMDESENA